MEGSTLFPRTTDQPLATKERRVGHRGEIARTEPLGFFRGEVRRDPVFVDPRDQQAIVRAEERREPLGDLFILELALEIPCVLGERVGRAEALDRRLEARHFVGHPDANELV